MSEPSNNLERLITRYLDQECSPEERRQLQEMLRKDSAAADFFDEEAAFDREFSMALRGAMGRAPVRRLPPPLWARIGRGVGLGLAAALAALVWTSPWMQSDSRTRPWRDGPRTSSAATWFGAPPMAGDTLVDDAARYGLPQVQLDKADRNWMVIPSEKPGEFMVIEIKSTRTQKIPLQRDF